MSKILKTSTIVGIIAVYLTGISAVIAANHGDKPKSPASTNKVMQQMTQTGTSMGMMNDGNMMPMMKMMTEMNKMMTTCNQMMQEITHQHKTQAADHGKP